MNTTPMMLAGALLCMIGLSACTQLNERPLKTDFNTRPELGLRLRVISSSSSSLPEEVVSKQQHVLRVMRVNPHQPGEWGGIQVGDVIVALNGQTVSGMGDSVALMNNLQWGDLVTLTIFRDNELQDIGVLLQQ